MKKSKRSDSVVQRHIRYLLQALRPEEVAARLRVTVYTVYRWRKGSTGKPHPGHLAAIRELVKAEKERRSHKSAGAAVA